MNNRVEGLISVALFWFFGLLIGVSLGSHNAWFAIFGIFSLIASFMIMPKKIHEEVSSEVEDDAKEVSE